MTWGNRSDHCPGAGKDLKGSVRDKMDQLSFYWAGDVPVDIHQHNSDWPKKGQDYFLCLQVVCCFDL